jgi:hypothetical protein
MVRGGTRAKVGNTTNASTVRWWRRSREEPGWAWDFNGVVERVLNGHDNGTAVQKPTASRGGATKKGHQKNGGRVRGKQNAITRDLKQGLVDAAERHRRDGKGAGGLVGYLRGPSRGPRRGCRDHAKFAKMIGSPRCPAPLTPTENTAISKWIRGRLNIGRDRSETGSRCVGTSGHDRRNA